MKFTHVHATILKMNATGDGKIDRARRRSLFELEGLSQEEGERIARWAKQVRRLRVQRTPTLFKAKHQWSLKDRLWAFKAAKAAKAAKDQRIALIDDLARLNGWRSDEKERVLNDYPEGWEMVLANLSALTRLLVRLGFKRMSYTSERGGRRTSRYFYAPERYGKGLEVRISNHDLPEATLFKPRRNRACDVNMRDYAHIGKALREIIRQIKAYQV